MKDPCHPLATTTNFIYIYMFFHTFPHVHINILIKLLINNDIQFQSFLDWWGQKRKEKGNVLQSLQS